MATLTASRPPGRACDSSGRDQGAVSTHHHASGPSSAHGHGGHSHGVSADTDRTRLGIALGLILTFMAAEVAVGIVSGSLALLSDAAHMLTDAGAIGLALLAAHLAAKPARGDLTFGFKRAEILSAQFNGATLLVLAMFIIYEAIRRLVNPPAVHGLAMLVVALVGILVNLVAAHTLSGANRRSMNVEGASQHIVTDLAAFIFTAIAGVIILTTGAVRADAIASLLVAAIMLRAAYTLLKASGRVFLEASPEGLHPDEIGHALAAQPGVVEVHDLHVWEVTSGFPALSAHVLVGSENNCHDLCRTLKLLLHTEFGIDHTTLQVEHEHTPLLAIEVPERSGHGSPKNP